ncbi:MAG: hypothetical protein JST92_21335, partial [Deltaproteobacteria bacterium]|nr:hypothetical protein [Deltaproteobacteria bacterium]
MPAPRALTVAGKIALWALGIAAGAAVLVAGGALLLLRTDFVGKRLAQEVTKQAAEAIEGKLSLSNVRTSGLLQVCAEDVKLDDPLGRPALRAKEVCVSIDVGALVSKAAHVRSLRLVEPQLEWTEVPGKEPGTKTTTLLLALASKRPPKPKSGGPTAWTVQADGLEIERGRVQLRKSPEAAPGFAVEELSLKDGAARWAATSLGAKLALSGEVTVPGKLAALVSIDAGLDGDPATGRALLREVRLKLGQSGLVASGSFDLGKKSGAIKLREIQVAPRELELLLPKRADGAHAIPLASLLTGEADLDANGTEATLALRLAGGGGKLTGAAKSTLTAPYKWSLDLDGKGIDPRALVFGAPKGRIASRLSVQGKGIPQIDEEGVNGDVKLKLVVGPAKLDAVGAIALELEGSLLGRYLIVKTLDLDALGLKIDGRGAASREELSLDLDIDASDLALLGRNVGVLSGKAALRLDGDAHLTTRLTGSVDKPDAELKVRGKKVAFGSSLEAQEMNISGLLKGKLERPHGSLTFESQHLSLGGIDLGKPRVGVQLDWPTAHLRVEADVKNNDGEAAPGQLLIVGDATLDKRGDGVLLSNLSLTLPGNRFELRKAAHIKFSPKETELEPIELHSDHGDVAVAAALQKPYGKFPGRIDAAFTLTQFDLDRVPDFVLPPDLGLKGMVDAHLGVTGVPSSPDVDGQLTLTNVEAAGVRGLSGKLQAAVQRGRLRVSGEVAGPFGAKAQLKASWPVLPLAQTPKASLDATLTLAGVDLAQVSSMKRPKDDERPPSMKGTVAAQL